MSQLQILTLTLAITTTAIAQEDRGRISAGRPFRDAQRFAVMANQPTGLLIPLYIYPANIHTNQEYNRLIDLKLTHPRVPVWAIVNPASGPGKEVDANYTKAIDRLRGAGIVTIGYVSTEYGKRDPNLVTKDLDIWQTLYPKIQGVFFDEMNYEDNAAAVERYQGYRRAATERGMWPTISNPGTATPERFFAGEVADVIVVHEGLEYPSEATLKGDYFGGYADYPPWARSVLMHTRPKFDAAEFARIKKYSRWVYVTDDVFRDVKKDNPWDSLPTYLETMFEALDQ
ncbi:MAG TPA: spherulation-specific family 4 protein [Planctomycetaceae bacterium]|nr:spherulation-specific family 4 protein [Planctomycetaceae bacterium]